MIDFEQEELNQNREWLLVLQTYADLEKVARLKANSEPLEEGQAQKFKSECWIQRIAEVDGVDTEDLSRIHGKLIAYGFLKFQLSGRETGVSYQLSPLGRLTLEQKFSEETRTSESPYDQSDAA